MTKMTSINQSTNQSINQSIKIYLATLEALQGDSKVAWANPKLPPKKNTKNNTIK